MRQIAQTAGVSKALLYHYFPSKLDLFKAAVAEAAQTLTRLIEPSAAGTPLEQLTASLDAYLAWIAANAQAWRKLMQSAATLPEARELVEGFRAQTLHRVVTGLTGADEPRPALRTALQGWLGYLDAAILDWTAHQDLPPETVRDLLVAAFGGGAVRRPAGRSRADARTRLT
jgi:AcrR family transcriptional regulator